MKGEWSAPSLYCLRHPAGPQKLRSSTDPPLPPHPIHPSLRTQGLFVPAQAAAAAALLSPSGNLSSALSMFFREDVVAWLGRKARGAGSGAAGSQLPAATLKRLVSGNVSAAAERLRHFAPARVGEDELPRAPVHQSALELAEAATSPKLLCRQDPTWHPWF